MHCRLLLGLGGYSFPLKTHYNFIFSDILPYMDRWFTESEKQKVVCKLQQEGQRQANFELIGVVKRKLQPFITLVAATKITQNDVLYKRMRDLIE